MSRDLTKFLAEWIAEGGSRIGQIAILATAAAFELRHDEDVSRDGLELFTKWEDARALASRDEAGKFRPLKTAPNLRRGWRLVLADAAQLRKALDYFYPAMLGVRASHLLGNLVPVPLRETLGRQTGMYAVTKNIADQEARAMVDRFCAGCLKQRLWELAAANPQPVQVQAGKLPLLCHEACNLLVAEARKVVKKLPAAK